MEPESLLFFDSGAGGLPYLKRARERLPQEHFVYLADCRNYPYGEKTAAQLRALVVHTMGEALRRLRPRLVVVACNTASVVALEALRARFDVPFVGVVPAVKPAAEHLAAARLAVVATRQTISGEYLKKLIHEFASGLEVLSIPVAELVDYAEYNPPPRDPERDMATVRRQLAPYLNDPPGSVVLGCTHFVLLEDAFRAVLGADVRLIDSREGVTRRVLALLAELPAGRRGAAAGAAAGSGAGSARLFLHGGTADTPRYRAFAGAFDLEFCGELDGLAAVDDVAPVDGARGTGAP